MDIIYEKLTDYGLVDSQYDFSKRYLGKSRSYYSTCKARRRPLGTEALVSLAMALERDLALLEAGRAYALSSSVRTRAAGVKELTGAVWGEVRRLGR
jgi:hypothetical protein